MTIKSDKKANEETKISTMSSSAGVIQPNLTMDEASQKIKNDRQEEVLQADIARLQINIAESNQIIQDQADQILLQRQEMERYTIANVAHSTHKVTKDEVVAIKDNIERIFPRLAWDAMSTDKNGWRIKMEIPEEAK